VSDADTGILRHALCRIAGLTRALDCRLVYRYKPQFSRFSAMSQSMLINRAAIDSAAEIVYAHMAPTPQQVWPMLSSRLGCEVWVKHENHTPVGAFKLRGGLVYFAELQRRGALPSGVISATRGNHGQSVAFAARLHGIPPTIVVPRGNSQEKNAAMVSLGAELIEYGDDFQAARVHAAALGDQRGLHMVPSLHPLLIAGVASYSMELLQAVSDLDVVYVPVGLGSGICGMIAARDALGCKAQIVGVVSAHATAYADSFDARNVISAPVTTRLADGMACSTPELSALEMMWAGVSRMVKVTDDEIAAAMQMMFECTHNTSEGAGAAALAGAAQEQERNEGLKVGVVLSGGNIDRSMFAQVLAR
jgi:threonine dehydratase